MNKNTLDQWGEGRKVTTFRATGKSKEQGSWLGLRPQEAWAEQIPRPYSRADENARSPYGPLE